MNDNPFIFMRLLNKMLDLQRYPFIIESIMKNLKLIYSAL